MNAPENIVSVQLRHLLEQLGIHQKARCEGILAQAHRTARHEIRETYREARARLHQAVLDTREQARVGLTSAAAQRQTRERQLRQQQDQALLERAWQPLQAALQQRWQNRETRQQWVDQLLTQAARVLVDTNWQIEHPQAWTAAERGAVEDRLVELHGYAPVFTATSSIRAGLRITAGETRVDGTIAGLLQDRPRIESILLAYLEECRRKAESKPIADES